jgi:hypothetical protein
MRYVGLCEYPQPRSIIGLEQKDYAQVERDVGAWLHRTTSEIPHDEIHQLRSCISIGDSRSKSSDPLRRPRILNGSHDLSSCKPPTVPKCYELLVSGSFVVDAVSSDVIRIFCLTMDKKVVIGNMSITLLLWQSQVNEDMILY